MPSVSATRTATSRSAASSSDSPLIVSPALGLDHRARHGLEAAAREVADEVDRELLARAERLHHGFRGRVAEEERELVGVLRLVDVAGREAAPRLDEHRKGKLVRQGVRQPGGGRADAVLLEEAVRGVLVDRDVAGLGIRRDDGRPDRREVAPARGQDGLVEVGQRQHRADGVLLAQGQQRRHVVGRVDERHERLAIGQVERRREPAGVGRHDHPAGPLARQRGLERDHHVAAHAGTREQDIRRRHRRAILADQAPTSACVSSAPETPRRAMPTTPSTMNGSALTACSTRPAESATAGGTP